MPVRIIAQELVPYYDRDKQKYGFQNKETHQIIIQPEYEDAVAWWKDFGIVRFNGKYGLINSEGIKASPFVLDYIFVEDCIDCFKGELAAYYYYKSNYRRPRKFYINENCDCVPKPFYPCPPMVKADTSSTPENLRLIQRAEKLYHQGEVKKSLEIAEKAIKADTSDASTWFWKANIMASSIEIIIGEYPGIISDKIDSDEERWMKESELIMINLDKRFEGTLEPKLSQEEYTYELKLTMKEDSVFYAEIETRRRRVDTIARYYNLWEEQAWDFWNSNYDTSYQLKKYYDGALRHLTPESFVYYSTLAGKYELDYLPKKEKKWISNEIKNKLPRNLRKSATTLMIHGGYTLFPYQKWNADISFGISDFIFESIFPLMAGAGLGYESGLDINVSNAKAFLFLNPIGPIHTSLNMIYAYGNNQRGFGFRPEFGFTFSAFTVLYGFNFISNSKFPGARGNMVGVRISLPTWRPNEFSKNLGNNLYR